MATAWISSPAVPCKRARAPAAAARGSLAQLPKRDWALGVAQLESFGTREGSPLRCALIDKKQRPALSYETPVQLRIGGSLAPNQRRGAGTN
jgi:hypothetical protein